MKKPLIGVAALYDSGRSSYWMLPGYMKGVEAAGGLPVMLPLAEDAELITQIADTCDAFLFTGGQDVSPSLYGHETSPNCGELCDARDKMEETLLRLVLGLDKPVLGICRGIQLINAALGGTLYQDLPTECPSNIEHHMSPPYDRPIHSVSIVRDSPLFSLLRADALPVNSYHHQAVDELAPALKPMAYSEDGLVEAVYMPGKKFVWAVQWHPEFSYTNDKNSLKLFKKFVSSAARDIRPIN